MRTTLTYRWLLALLFGGCLGQAPLLAADAASTAAPAPGSEAQAPPLPPMPPSPSSVPGIRIWPDPAFTHWPAIAYADETRNLSFALPNQRPGLSGTIGWRGGEMMPITMPSEGDSASGLLPLSLDIGTHTAQVVLGTATWPLLVRIADVRQPWPLARLQDGFPVDAHGVPVVLLDRRRRANEERKWSLTRAHSPRPQGRALMVGDPMEALGVSLWDGQDAICRTAIEQRYPSHAVLVALADLGLPRTVVWCPGNQELFGAGWSEEEERVMGALRSRCDSLGILPRLVLVAPPVPIDESLKEIAARRRELLISSAISQGWVVIDAEAVVGPAETANRVQDGLFTRYPCGAAQGRLIAAIRTELTR